MQWIRNVNERENDGDRGKHIHLHTNDGIHTFDFV